MNPFWKAVRGQQALYITYNSWENDYYHVLHLCVLGTVQVFTYIISSNSHNHPEKWALGLSYFSYENTKAQRS